MQRAIGSALIGVVADHRLYVLHGHGANGKSVFLGALQHVFGDYAMTTAPKLLMTRYGEQHTTELVDLRGKRLACCMESGDGQSLDEDRVKWVTGGDRITARRMRQNHVTFVPSHTLFLCTNHKPRVRGTTNAMWRRIRLWPFDLTVPEHWQDAGLPAKLKAEAPGILAWCVQGCLAYQRHVLGTCDEVKEATNEYRRAEDVVGNFVRDCCVEGAQCSAMANDLLTKFKEYTGNPKMSATALGRILAEREYTPDQMRGRRLWRGIGLLNSNES